MGERAETALFKKVAMRVIALFFEVLSIYGSSIIISGIRARSRAESI